MSHVATNWAFQQRGLKPSAKIILLTLADCHNPVHGCFPTQAYLADVCEVNRDTVNAQLSLLEDQGLIRRVRSVDPQTKRQRPTRYKLAFEADFDVSGGSDGGSNSGSETPENAVSENPTQTPKAVSEIPTEPCRKNAESRVGNSDTNLVIEQVREPVTAPEVQVAAESLIGFQRFWDAHPKRGNRDRTIALWLAAEKSGVDPQHIISEAHRYRQMNLSEDKRYLVSSDLWLEQRRWEEQPGRREQSASLIAQQWADAVNKGKYVPPSAITPGLAREMVSAGLVTVEQLRNVQVYL